MTGQQIVFRVDASITIGSGHIMRCLTLADSLRQGGNIVTFICRELDGNMCDLIAKRGYSIRKLPYRPQMLHDTTDRIAIWSGEIWQNDAEQTIEQLKPIAAIKSIEWLIIDHYGLDIQWEQQVGPYVNKIMVIDDLADRKHVCNLLLDQNLYFDMQERYEDLIPQYSKTLLGPQYAILRQEFYQAKPRAKIREGIKRILMFFGGSDPTNETLKALQALSMLDKPDILIDIVVGGINPHKDEIRQFCKNLSNSNFYCQVSNMAELMVNADLAIGAGGSTTWERCYLGLPAITIILAENQRETTETVARKGAIINLGWHSEVKATDIYEKICDLIQNTDKLKSMSVDAFEICENSSSVSGIRDIIATMENIETQV